MQIPEHTCWRSKPAIIMNSSGIGTIKSMPNPDPASSDPATEAQCPACVFLKIDAKVTQLQDLIREVLAAEQVYPGKVSWMDVGQMIDVLGWFVRAKEALK